MEPNMTVSQECVLNEFMNDVTQFELGLEGTDFNIDHNEFMSNSLMKMENEQNFAPVDTALPTGEIPSTEQFPGPYGFELLLNSEYSKKNSWVYSYVLEQVFINIGKNLLVQFHINFSQVNQPLFIRSLLVYSSSDFINVPVDRCTLHSLESDRNSQAHVENECHCQYFNMVGHVMQSTANGAMYCYDRNSKRHSIVVQVSQPQAGCDTIVIPYSFTCKTSCPTGMQRRPVSVIFTLETITQEVVGRKILPVKICSCPKRDKERMEKDYYQETPPPKTKKLCDPPPSLTPSVHKKLKTEHVENKNPSSNEEIIQKILKTHDEFLQLHQQSKKKLDEVTAYINQLRHNTSVS